MRCSRTSCRKTGCGRTLTVIQKSANASTLDIINRVKEALPKIEARLPASMTLTQLFDQSIFVRAAINGVLKEGVIAACLTALMILLFLGSWRSTLVVATSIPLSILCSIIIMGALGQTLNIMTLGGLALAVGILVDDATVEVENIHRNLAMGKPMVRAILDGASQIAVPAFVSTLCICIVFVPVFFLSGDGEIPVHAAGDGGHLRDAGVVLPLADGGADDGEISAQGAPGRDSSRRGTPDAEAGVMGLLQRIYEWFNGGFEKLRDRYTGGAGMGARPPGRAVLVDGRAGAGFGSAWCRSSGGISFRRWMRASSGCMCGRRRGRGWRRRRRVLQGGRDRSGRWCRRTEIHTVLA